MKAIVKLKMIAIFIAATVTITSCSNLKANYTLNEKEQIENMPNNLEPKAFSFVFDPVPKIKLKEGQPEENWVKGKSIYFENLPYQIESTIHLYIENSSDEIESSDGIVHAFLEHENVMYDLGNVSSYGIEDVNVSLEDRTSNSIKEINISGGMGATYVELKVIEYNRKSNEWINLLTMGTPQILDLNGDGQEEIVAVSSGSLPSFVDIYKWNENHFEKASIADVTGNTYANLYMEDGEWIIESGKWGEGQDTTPRYYKYEDGILVSLASLKQDKDISQPLNIELVSNEEFYQAINKLEPDLAKDPRVKEPFEEKSPNINQLYINTDFQYLVGWIEDLGFNSAIVIFKIEGAERIPVYFDTPSNRINSVRSFNHLVDNISLIEITGYNASGSSSSQMAKILSLNNSKIETVWQMNFLENISNIDKSTGNEVTNSYYAPYILTVDSQNNPSIIVSEVEVIGEDIRTKQCQYIWNSNEERFTEKK